MKFVLAIFIVLSLIGGSGAAIAAPSAGCTMDGAREGTALDHEKMGCCTPECATPAPAAVLPAANVDGDAVEQVALLDAQLEPVRPPSFILSTDDPPPRAFFA